MNIGELKLTYRNASEEHKEKIINAINNRSTEYALALHVKGIITKGNLETLIEFFNNLEKNIVGICKQCYGDNFKKCRRCYHIEDFIMYLKMHKEETVSKTDVIDDLNQVLKLVYKRIYAIEKRLDNLEEATWGQKTTFTITECQ